MMATEAINSNSGPSLKEQYSKAISIYSKLEDCGLSGSDPEYQEHLRAFLGRLEEYEILTKSDKQYLLSELGQLTLSADLRRNEKIARFKMERDVKIQLKALTEQLQLKDQMNANSGEVDVDDVERQILMTTIQLFIQKSIASLRMIKDEKEMLEFAKKRSETEQRTSMSISGSSADRVESRVAHRKLADLTGPLMDAKGKPLRPFIVRSQREAIKENVFKSGHNLPTMTIDEYLEREIARGNFLSGGTERPEKVVAADNDDAAIEAEMYKARAFDEFKDENPRGWGNRHNKG
ncbi:Type 2A phosphatase-associated protein 42, variant 2 [Batrachochytrium dendrobatidis]